MTVRWESRRGWGSRTGYRIEDVHVAVAVHVHVNVNVDVDVGVNVDALVRGSYAPHRDRDEDGDRNDGNPGGAVTVSETPVDDASRASTRSWSAT